MKGTYIVYLWRYGQVDIHLALPSHKDKMMVIAFGRPRIIAHHIAILLNMDKLIILRPAQQHDHFNILRRPIEDGTLDPNRLPPMDFRRGFAEQRHWLERRIRGGLFNHGNAVPPAHTEHREVPVVHRAGHLYSLKLLSVLVDVNIEPSPLAVPVVVEVVVAIEARHAVAEG